MQIFFSFVCIVFCLTLSAVAATEEPFVADARQRIEALFKANLGAPQTAQAIDCAINAPLSSAARSRNDEGLSIRAWALTRNFGHFYAGKSYASPEEALHALTAYLHEYNDKESKRALGKGALRQLAYEMASKDKKPDDISKVGKNALEWLASQPQTDKISPHYAKITALITSSITLATAIAFFYSLAQEIALKKIPIRSAKTTQKLKRIRTARRLLLIPLIISSVIALAAGAYVVKNR